MSLRKAKNSILSTLLVTATALTATTVGWAQDQKIQLLPPSLPVHRIFVVDDGLAERRTFILSLLQTLLTMTRANPELTPPNVSLFRSKQTPALPAIDALMRDYFADTHVDESGCWDWIWTNTSDFGWIRNWGVFVKDGDLPLLLRFQDDCIAKHFATVAGKLQSSASEYVDDMSFAGGNIREFDATHAIVGASDGDTENLGTLLETRGVTVTKIDTSWLDQTDVDNLLMVVPGKPPAKPYIVYADPKTALKLLEAAPKDASIAYHDPQRQSLYASESVRSRGWNGPYASGRYVRSLSVAEFLKTFGDYNRGLQAKIDKNLAVLREQLKLTDAQLIPVPTLWGPSDEDLDDAKAAELLPNAANGVAMNLILHETEPNQTNELHLFVGDTHFDPFNQAINTALKPLGAVHTLDTWGLSSVYGNVNCTTNILRFEY